MSTYKVSLIPAFPYPQRIRSGITVTPEQPYQGELTDVQLEAVQADEQFIVEQVKEAKTAKPASKPAEK